MKKIILLITAVSLFSCSKDSLDPTLADVVAIDNSLNNEADLRLVLNGAYNQMSQWTYWGRDIIITGEVRADNVYANFNSGRFTQMADMGYDSRSTEARTLFHTAYRTIGLANIAINSGSLTGNAARITHAKGEAHALRAFAHFDLLRLYGQQHVSGQGGSAALGVPYITEYRSLDLNKPRLTVAETKQRIYDDLDMALSMMNPSFNDNAKVSLSTHAVNAIKSRVATYFGDTAIALAASEAVINSGAFTMTSGANLATYWAATSAGAGSIFELAQLPNDNNGINGIANIYRGPSYGDIQVINAFPDNAEFGDGDARNSEAMIGVQANRLRNIGKYPTMGVFSDNIKVIRYEEIVLNYAEALLASNPTEALNRLNSVASVKGGSTYTVANIDNILKERRKELCFEGFRFDDLVRTGRNIPVIDELVQTHQGPAYGSYKLALPIPQAEMDTNSAMVQNNGYVN